MHPSLKYKHATSQSNNCLKPFGVNENDLLLIIKNLDANKAHEWDDISIWMIHSRGKSIAFSLQLLFNTILKREHFQKTGKKKCCTS